MAAIDQGSVILVLNAGSSSLKYQLVTIADRDSPGADHRDRSGSGAGARASAGDPVSGIVERIGEPGSEVADHEAAFARATRALRLDQWHVVAVGHRVVHGGTRFQAPVRVNDEVLRAIEQVTPLAPLHNPANLAGIRAARSAVPGVPHVAVFDTAFHATLPTYAATYALDQRVATEHGIRRYGFHGISVRYVTHAAARLLRRPVTDLNMIVLHLGNGASATAVAAGRSVATSMGMTPLEGLAMGTRTGDIDPAVVFHLARQARLDLAQIEDLYQHRSGLLGLCGDNDMRAVEQRARSGDPAATLALAVYCHRIREYVGAYHAVLGRLDAIVFTAGVGEHSAQVRAGALAGLDMWGINVDPSRNAATGAAARVISRAGTAVAVCVVPTDEEHAIAIETADLLTL